jgi:hypothetical protein
MNYDIHWDSIKYQTYWQNFNDSLRQGSLLGGHNDFLRVGSWSHVKKVLKTEYNVDYLYINDQPYFRFESPEAFFEFKVIWS